MAKEHNRSHIAVSRGRFILLLLPPLFRKQDLQLLFLHQPSPGALLQTQNRPLLLLHTPEPPPSSSVAPKVGDRRGHGKPTPMKEHTLRPLAGPWHQSPSLPVLQESLSTELETPITYTFFPDEYSFL